MMVLFISREYFFSFLKYYWKFIHCTLEKKANEYTRYLMLKFQRPERLNEPLLVIFWPISHALGDCNENDGTLYEFIRK